MSFSQESLQQIKKELDAVPDGGKSDFSIHLDTEEIRAHYYWSEGIEIRWQNGRYICTQHLERSTKTYEIPNEADAVEKFIRIARHAKAY